MFEHDLDAGVVQLLLEVRLLLGRDRDREVMHRSEHLGVRAEVESGKVEEGEEVAVADIEEEVGAARVVTVLEEFRQREFEQVLVERDRLLDIGGEQGSTTQDRSPRAFRCRYRRPPPIC